MTKSTITRARLETLANAEYCKSNPGAWLLGLKEVNELARMALAAMDSEPVAYISKSDFDAGYPHILARRYFNKACTMAVYAAQPAPVVPEEKQIPNTLSMYAVDAVAAIAEVKGWNACRAAMLAAAPQSPGSEPTTVPGKWIPVSEQMPEVGDIVLTAMEGVVNVGEMECSAANCRFFTSVISGRELPATYWMPLPAPPKEVK
ncbi:Eaa1 [Klebsiella pneumoniae]|nr:DUF551 domain-containing protein [Klebsiella pneumoniae]SXG40501.1 Eaa1 [Klebsiella pneumoniae]